MDDPFSITYRTIRCSQDVDGIRHDVNLDLLESLEQLLLEGHEELLVIGRVLDVNGESP